MVMNMVHDRSGVSSLGLTSHLVGEQRLCGIAEQKKKAVKRVGICVPCERKEIADVSCVGAHSGAGPSAGTAAALAVRFFDGDLQ